MRKNNQITKMNQIQELSDKDFKETIIKMHQQLITTSLETNEKENCSKEIEDIKRTKW